MPVTGHRRHGLAPDPGMLSGPTHRDAAERLAASARSAEPAFVSAARERKCDGLAATLTRRFTTVLALKLSRT